MRFFTYSLGISLLLGVTACSSTGGTASGVSAGGNAGSGGSTNGGTGNTSSGGSAGSHAGSSSSLGGTASTAGGSGGASGGTAAGGGGASATGGSAGGSSMQSGGAQVLTWVPPYHVNEAKQMLAANFGNLTAADGISRLALQFWITNGGSLNLDSVSEADITWFHDWAHQHGVQMLLCVDNYVGNGWSWSEAQRSFKDNGPAFAASILSEISRLDLDGVDLDLEGQDSPGVPVVSPGDQTAYTKLAQTLATALHPLGKVVTVDSFSAQWNAPNWDWWPDLLPIVDGITAMGYEQNGLDKEYQGIVDHSMPSPQKLTLGVPSNYDTWLNHSVGEQLGWIVNQGQIGVGIWDASFSAAGWQTQDTWAQLKTIKAR